MSGTGLVAVAGVTGFVGRAVARRLLERGWRVRGLTRSLEKARTSLRGLAVEVVTGEAREAGTARRLVEGAAACVNTVGILREQSGVSFRAAHVDVTRCLVEACRGGGVRRFVQVSALSVRDEAPTEYQRSKFEAEQILQRSDLEWTILRPSLIHGAEGGFTRQAVRWVRGEAAPWFFLPYFTRGEREADVPLAAKRRVDPKVQPVSVEDVSWVVGECLERRETVGEIYPLAGSEVLTWAEMLRVIRDSVRGARRELEPRGIPVERAVAAVRVARALGVGSLLPFDEGMARMGAEDSTASTAKVRAHLGMEPRGFTATFRPYASRL